MKKTVKIEMYYDCINKWGERRWNYVCSMWGDHIEFDNHRWYLRDVDNGLICSGDISQLHGDGTDDFDVKFKNVVCF